MLAATTEATTGDPRVTVMDPRAVLSQRRRRRPTGDDPQVVARAQAGDEHAFAELVDRYGGAVISLCYASTLNAAESEDLAQDVFVAAWHGLPRFRGASTFSTWLFALARNACVDQPRRRAVRPRLAGDRESAADVVDEAPRETARASCPPRPSSRCRCGKRCCSATCRVCPTRRSRGRRACPWGRSGRGFRRRARRWSSG